MFIKETNEINDHIEQEVKDFVKILHDPVPTENEEEINIRCTIVDISQHILSKTANS
jgi:hypothetical protein